MTTEQPHAEEQHDQSSHEHASFEVGENQVPWFLWVCFVLIIMWAMISWIPLFGY